MQRNDDDIKKVTLRLAEEAVVPAMKERGWDTESFQYDCEQVRIHDYRNKWIGGKWHLMSKIMLERIWSDEVEPYGEFYLKVDAPKITVKSSFYCMNKLILSVSEMLFDFAERKILEFQWSNSPKRFEGSADC